MTGNGRPQGPDARIDGPVARTGLDRELEALLSELRIEKAPRSLTRRLRRIPRGEGGEPAWWQGLLSPGPARRWLLAPALAAGLLLVGIALLLPKQPSRQEILQVRQELAVAFQYIDKAGAVTGREIHSALGDELSRPIRDSLSKHIPFTEQNRKEDTT
jgi:hypothetical protein